MLVLIQNESLSTAEQQLVEWLRTWGKTDGPSGVAIINCNVPGRDRLHQVDGVIWTPQGCVVVEVKGFAERQHGELLATPNGPWLIDGQPAALYSSSTRNPLDQLRDNLLSTKTVLDAEVPDKFYAGLIFVVPAEGAQVLLAPSMLPNGVEVVLGDHEYRIRGYFHQLERGKATWTADDIARAFHALHLSGLLPTAEQLAAEGFTGPIISSAKPYQPAAFDADAPPVDDFDPEVLAPPAQERQGLNLYQYSPWRLYPRGAEGSKLDAAFLRVLLVVGALVGVIWMVWFVVSVYITYGGN